MTNPRFVVFVLDTGFAIKDPILERLDVDKINTLTIKNIKFSNPWLEEGPQNERVMVLHFKAKDDSYGKLFASGGNEYYASVFVGTKTDDAILYGRQESYNSRTYYSYFYDETLLRGLSGYMYSKIDLEDALTYWFTKAASTEEKTIQTNNGTFNLKFNGNDSPSIEYTRKSLIGRSIKPLEINWKTFDRN